MRLPRIPDLPAVPPGSALLPLRLFLGGTFVYAGIEKLTDQGFLAEGAPTYIGSQLEAFAEGLPPASSCGPSPSRSRRSRASASPSPRSSSDCWLFPAC